MKNLKIGDVVKGDVERTVLEVLTNTALLSRYDDPTEVGGWFTLDELKDYTLVQPKEQWSCGVDKLLTQRDNQAYTSLVEGIKAQVKDINGEGSVFDDFATDILKNVVKPLYGKE